MVNFKEKWLKEDKTCPHCNQITHRERGLTKQNIKRLLFTKPKIEDLIILFMIFMVLLLAWRYNVETKMCRDYLKDKIDITFINSYPSETILTFTNLTNLTNLNGAEDNQNGG